MSGWVISTVLAVPFTTTSETFTFMLGATPYTATLAAGTYRVNLAPAATDAIRVLAAALAAAPGLPGGVTWVVAIDATTGLVSITGNTLFKITTLHSTALGKVLGFTAAMSASALLLTATRQPWYTGFFVSASGGVWMPRRSGARERDAGGTVYSFAGSLTHYDRELTSSLIPWDPDRATEAESPATPLWPLRQYLGDVGGTGTATRAWGLTDLWVAAQNRVCALALENWPDVVGSTTERYVLGMLGSDSPAPDRMDPVWNRYVDLKWVFVLGATGQTGTRA